MIVSFNCSLLIFRYVKFMCIISILFLFSHLFLCIPLPHTGCSINVGGREGGRKEGRGKRKRRRERGKEAPIWGPYSKFMSFSFNLTLPIISVSAVGRQRPAPYGWGSAPSQPALFLSAPSVHISLQCCYFLNGFPVALRVPTSCI